MGTDRCDRASPQAACRHERCEHHASRASRKGIPSVACSSSRKKRLILGVAIEHGTPPSADWFTSNIKQECECPRQESNLILDLRGVACLLRHTPRTCCQCPTRESNPVLQDRSLPCYPSHSQGMDATTWPRLLNVAKFMPRRLSQVSRPGLEPGPGPSEGPMLSTTPSGHRKASRPGVESGPRP